MSLSKSAGAVDNSRLHSDSTSKLEEARYQTLSDAPEVETGILVITLSYAWPSSVSHYIFHLNLPWQITQLLSNMRMREASTAYM